MDKTLSFPLADIQILIKLCNAGKNDSGFGGTLCSTVAAQLSASPPEATLADGSAGTFADAVDSHKGMLNAPDKTEADKMIGAIRNAAHQQKIGKIGNGGTGGSGGRIIITQSP